MARQPLAERILPLAGPVAASLGCAVWGVEAAPAGRRTLVRVYIEAPSGVTIDQCAEVSRSLGAALEVEDAIPGPYTLEVSSPGLSRRFFEPSQLPPYVGRELEVSLTEPIGERKNFTGRLAEAGPEGFVLETESGRLELSWERVKKARLVHAF